MHRLLLLALLLPTLSFAADPEFQLSIQDHKFEPAELHVPAGKRIKLIVINRDPTPEEFESYELHREQLIPGNTRGTVYIGPLAPGRYPFFADFHPKTTTGVVVAE